MRFVYRGILGCVAAAGLIAAYGCGSDIEDEPAPQAGGTGSGAAGGAGGSGNTSGAGGGGSGGMAPDFPCTPKADICYGNRPWPVAGSECMANVDNTDAKVVQFRQTWSRVVSPVGNTTDIVYGVLRGRAALSLPDCAQSAGAGGYIQISSWDRTNTDKTQQTVTTGYANYSNSPAGEMPIDQVVANGMCFIDWEYSFNGPATVSKVVDFSRYNGMNGMQRALPQPWKIKPVVSKRIANDFTNTADVKAMVTEEYAGVVFIDEDKGYIHGYSPLSYVTVLDNTSGGLATPIREVDIKSQFNDKSFNCMGRFRADKMNTDDNCDTGLDQTNPQWGCKDDTACPVPGVGETTDKGGLGPGYTTGYFLIVDLERVWSNTLQSTLCVSYPGTTQSETDGWSNPASWGKNCRGSPKWDPNAADDAGLPMGDWCSKTNSAATATCHDAYRSRSYSAAQAFKVQPVTKTGTTLDNTTFTGTCGVKK